MEESIKLSIIVPVYNAGKFLDKCLKSLVSQNISAMEIILVNDGSTDESLGICNDYAQKDSRIKVLSQANSGQAKARNVGIDLAVGQYITFVDSDDWVDNDYYEKLLNKAILHDADIACASIIRKKKNYEKYRVNYLEEREYTLPQEKIDAAKCPNMCYVWNKVYRKSLIDRLSLRFVEGMICEDVDFVNRAVFYSNKLVTVPNTYYHYIANGASTVKTMRKSDKKRADSIVAKDMMIKFFTENNLSTEVSNMIKRKKCIKFCGITVLKIYEWQTQKKYYLFGIIPVLEEIIYA